MAVGSSFDYFGKLFNSLEACLPFLWFSDAARNNPGFNGQNNWKVESILVLISTLHSYEYVVDLLHMLMLAYTCDLIRHGRKLDIPFSGRLQSLVKHMCIVEPNHMASQSQKCNMT